MNLAAIAYTLLAVDHFTKATAPAGRARGLGSLGDVGEGLEVPPSAIGNLFAQPEIARRMSPTFGKGAAIGRIEPGQSIEHRAKRIAQLIREGARDPAVRRQAGWILAQRNADGSWRTPEKDWKGEADAIYHWVRKNMRYTRDHATIDQYAHPARTLFDRPAGVGAIGDCLPSGTLLLVEGHRLVPIEMVQAGQRIWGLDGWTTVKRVWAKGVLPTRTVRLNNGSSFQATEDHHLYVKSCAVHGPLCNGLTSVGRCRHAAEAHLLRIALADAEPRMQVAVPSRIAFGAQSMDPRRAWIEGLYLADGWSQDAYENAAGEEVRYEFRIAGKDGKPKEQQKREIAAVCAELDIETGWHDRYIRVRDRAWAARLAQFGTRAWEKHAPSLDLDEGAATELLRGIMADSGANSRGSGRTFTTTSRALALQVRLLWKMQGRSCGESFIEDHGGLGSHPVWRICSWSAEHASGKAQKALRILDVEEDPIDQPCWDITTEDGFVYLPAADVTVSNCDDSTATGGALLAAVGHQPVLRIVAAKQGGLANPDFNHIYLGVRLASGGVVADGRRGAFYPLDMSINKGPGWQPPKEMIAKYRDFEVPL